MSDPKPRFTGIFIPVEILEIKELSPIEKMLLSWIDALYCKDHGGCYASNDYLAGRFNLKSNTIAKSISKLRRLGFIEDGSFDGIRRIIRATINRYVEKKQSEGALEKNPMQENNPNKGWKKNQKRVGQKSIESLGSIHIDSKEESKDKHPQPPKRGQCDSYSSSSIDIKKKTEPRYKSTKSNIVQFKPQGLKVKQSPKDKFGEDELVLLTPGQYSDLIGIMGEPRVKELIEELNDYIASIGKRYKSHYHTLRQWYKRKEKEKTTKIKPKTRDEQYRQEENERYFEANPEKRNLF